ncbi:MAG: hypothetical protein HRU38_20875 [Saccharospirillaceae bacterium]|nr:hypothetical protein [Pseudomonadales bacterium]NRB81086.1 hypothetical protein [Saccharospirillaceae bacterium]
MNTLKSLLFFISINVFSNTFCYSQSSFEIPKKIDNLYLLIEDPTAHPFQGFYPLPEQNENCRKLMVSQSLSEFSTYHLSTVYVDNSPINQQPKNTYNYNVKLDNQSFNKQPIKETAKQPIKELMLNNGLIIKSESEYINTTGIKSNNINWNEDYIFMFSNSKYNDGYGLSSGKYIDGIKHDKINNKYILKVIQSTYSRNKSPQQGTVAPHRMNNSSESYINSYVVLPKSGGGQVEIINCQSQSDIEYQRSHRNDHPPM